MGEWLFADIERRFQEERDSSRLDRRLREWRSEHPPLARFEGVDAVVGFFRDRSNPYDEKDEIAGILCGLSAHDELAKLLLLKLYLPGLVTKRRALFELGLRQEELEFALLTGFLDRAGKTRPGTQRLSMRLVGDARDRALSEIRKIERRAERLKPEVLTPLDEVFAAAPDPTDIAEEVVSKEAAEDLIRNALNQNVIGKDQAVALWAADVEDLRFAEVAARFGISEGAAKVRVHRARNRLASWLRKSRGKESPEDL
jgi:hypothetical protein